MSGRVLTIAAVRRARSIASETPEDRLDREYAGPIAPRPVEQSSSALAWCSSGKPLEPAGIAPRGDRECYVLGALNLPHAWSPAQL